MNKKEYVGFNEDPYDIYQKYNRSEKYSEYDNIIICAHPKDETIYFDSVISGRSLVIFLTNTESDKTNKLTQYTLTRKHVTYIFLNDIEAFDEDYDLSSRLKGTIKDYLSYSNFDKIITHTQVPVNVDVQNRRIYDYIKSLNLPNHYIVDYRPNEKRAMNDATQNKILNNYASLYDKKYKQKMYDLYMDVASHVFGIKKAN